MANVTYLLGAGASCNCLPTYANFSQRFGDFETIIHGCLKDMESSEKEDAKEILNLVRRLKLEFTFHATPDTIAKKYFHLQNGGKDLDNLKIILVLFFMYEQSISSDFINNSILLKEGKKSVIDRRYDSFIAAILEPKYGQVNISSNFNILTWNYDLQFELCFRNYYQQSLSDTQLKLQCIPSPNTLTEFKYSPNKFSIIHLNGIAFNKVENNEQPFGQFITNRKEFSKHLVSHFNSMKNSKYLLEGKGLLNFAWERSDSSPYPKNAMDLINSCAAEIASKTEVLVIIGYSFPIFNRAVDSILFEKMEKLKKIYVQSPIAADLKNVIFEAFPTIKTILRSRDIQLISALEYFHIPHEANRKISEFIVGVA